MKTRRIEYAAKQARAGRALLADSTVIVAAKGPTPDAEAKAREALPLLRSAMDWLDGMEGFEEAHSDLDQAGDWIRRSFGCTLHREGKEYQQTCPVALAHNRIGLSPGMVIIRSECSICGEDPENCSHIAGRSYDGTFCARVITEAKLLEVSFVASPAQPDARIHSISISADELTETLGPEFEAGMDVSCDRCLSPCQGIFRPFG